MNESLEIAKELKNLVPSRWNQWVYEGSDNMEQGELYYQNLLNNVNVQKLLYDWEFKTKRFYLIHAGRRSGKTELVKRMVLEYALKNSNKRILIGTPTFGQGKNIFWEDFKRFFKLQIGEFCKVSEGDLRLTLFNNTTLSLFALDVGERIEGDKIDLVILDEFADAKQEIFQNNIAAGLSDTQGMAIILSTPEGTHDQFYKFVSNTKNNKKGWEDWGVYHWSTIEVRKGMFNILKDIDNDKERMGIELWKQEYLGEFITYAGLAYKYIPELHLAAQPIKYNKNLSLDVCCDFNVKIMSWPICQSSQDMTYVLDEATTRFSSVYEQIKELEKTLLSVTQSSLEELKIHPINFYGDASGLYIRDPASTEASWRIIEEELVNSGYTNISFYLSKSNPRIANRIQSVNSRLKTADNKIHIQINQSVKELILDFELITYDDILKGEKEKTGSERSHSSDGFGYYIEKEFPVSKHLSSTIEY